MGDLEKPPAPSPLQADARWTPAQSQVAVATQSAVDAADLDEELLELTDFEMWEDPLFGAVAWQSGVRGDGVRGEVVPISRESTTGERLYLVRYADGTDEDLPAAEVEALRRRRGRDRRGAEGRGRGRRGRGRRRR